MINLTELLTEDEYKIIGDAAQTVWNDIGYDALAGKAYLKQADIERVTFSARDVIEMVLDAGRLEDELEHAATPELMAKWKTIRHEHRVALLRKTFLFGRYGL